MRVYDVTVPLHPQYPVWEGEQGPEVEWHGRIDEGGHCNISSFSMGSHTGTHADAPAHFVRDGGTIEGLDVDRLVGPARVYEFDGTSDISAEDLDRLGVDGRATRILFKTPNARLWTDPAFHKDYVAIDASAARRLVELGIELVGIDYLSIEAFDSPGFEVHHTLLEAGVVVLEGADLREVPPGDYLLVCAPLKLSGAEGAPARTFLIAED
jgi:arylformamidase